MEDLHPEVEGLVELLEKSIDPILKQIKDRDWSELEGVKLKKTHKIQKVWTDYNITHAKNLYAEAKKQDNLMHPRVKALLKTTKLLVDLYETRYDNFYNKRDWVKYMEDESSEDEDMIEAELSFQEAIKSTLMVFKKDIRDFDTSKEKERVEIPVYNATPIPLMMQESVEKRYPKVREYLERRIANYEELKKE